MITMVEVQHMTIFTDRSAARRTTAAMSTTPAQPRSSTNSSAGANSRPTSPSSVTDKCDRASLRSDLERNRFVTFVMDRRTMSRSAENRPVSHGLSTRDLHPTSRPRYRCNAVFFPSISFFGILGRGTCNSGDSVVGINEKRCFHRVGLIDQRLSLQAREGARPALQLDPLRFVSLSHGLPVQSLTGRSLCVS
jgi:hypothetical protein